MMQRLEFRQIPLYANGMYDYLDEEESTWPIAFQSIKPDTSGMTVGVAEIEEKDEFYLSPILVTAVGSVGGGSGPHVLHGIHSHSKRL